MSNPASAVPADGAVRIHERFGRLTQPEIWEAIVDPEMLSSWLGGPCFIEPRVGGGVLFDLADDGVVASGVVRSFEPPRDGYRVAMVEHTFVEARRPELTSICIWSVTETPEGCDLHFTHDGLGEAEHDKLASAWNRRLGAEMPHATPARPATPLAEAQQALASAATILLVSFIGPEVPTTLANEGFTVLAKTGPDPDDWAECRLHGGELVTSPLDSPPEAVDLVHLDVSHAFDEYVGVARQLGAHTFWYHSARTRPPAPADNRGCWLPAQQSNEQRKVVEAAGIRYIDDHYIADVARSISGESP